MTLEAIKYKNGELKILDQLLLPAESRYIDINGVEEGWHAIHSMQVSKLKYPNVEFRGYNIGKIVALVPVGIVPLLEGGLHS